LHLLSYIHNEYELAGTFRPERWSTVEANSCGAGARGHRRGWRSLNDTRDVSDDLPSPVINRFRARRPSAVLQKRRFTLPRSTLRRSRRDLFRRPFPVTNRFWSAARQRPHRRRRTSLHIAIRARTFCRLPPPTRKNVSRFFPLLISAWRRRILVVKNRIDQARDRESINSLYVKPKCYFRF